MANLTPRELATVLHGLRLIQEMSDGTADCYHGMCSHFSDVEALNNREIDILCERLNGYDPDDVAGITYRIAVDGDYLPTIYRSRAEAEQAFSTHREASLDELADGEYSRTLMESVDAPNLDHNLEGR